MSKKKKRKKKKKTPKNKIIQEPVKQESKSSKKLFLGLGLAGIVLAASAGIISSFYKKKEKEYILPKVIYAATSKERWQQVINGEGILFSEEELQNRYEIFRENERVNTTSADRKKDLEKILNEKLSRATKSFEKNPVPEAYKEEVFCSLWATAHVHQYLLIAPVPDRVVQVFNIPEDPLVAELFNYSPKNDTELVGKILNCSTLIVHKRLECSGKIPGETIDQFIQNLRNGVGDCSDYTYSIANIYYALCHSMKRDDLYSRIRVMHGFYLESDGKFKEFHGWLQMLDANNKWDDLEMNKDELSSNDQVNLSTPVLYFHRMNPEPGLCVPMVSSIVVYEGGEHKIKFKAHVLPQNGK